MCPSDRIDVDYLLSLIQQEKYFVLHAPRQTGKTSVLLALADLLNASDKFHCLYVNIEGAQTAREDEGRGMKGILGAIGMDAINTLRDSFVEDHSEEVLEKTGPDFALAKMLTQ